ncbi:hypothetical protein CKM354_000903700 [Cercospora kikuchii]|uniref:Uncharacterized protein n=1 Tax=Cercospora kikuchii TaxID=84275 RepID=A0A9P3CN70_9PEZI|nr:uncharacterized protein CKM354_000903700 [Cercospora kikuchii]GIZ45889.1 hypothetical protein CKM354_000903700 [Cercospora kikuchii]
MRCLGIPVDHRLRGLRRTPGEQQPTQDSTSEHIRILSEFGRSLTDKNDDDFLSAHELDFGLELARPECTGGLVIVLYRPDPSQDYSEGYVAEEARCRTLAAVKDLISNATNGMMDTDAITILDSMAFISEDYDGSVLHVQAQKTFLRALEAKRPDVVLSCFRTKTKIKFMKDLQGQGIGKDNHLVRMTFPATAQEFQRISAFHPSYAVNRMAFDPCFRHLLMLQFHQAVSVCWGMWEHKLWMAHLRACCAEKAWLYKGPLFMQVRKLSNFVHAFEDLEDSLKEVRYFRLEDCTGIRDAGRVICDRGISSTACEISVLLQDDGITKSGELPFELMKRTLHDALSCLGMGQFLLNTEAAKAGYCDHLQLVDKAPHFKEPHMKAFHEMFLTLLRQLNLTFTATDGDGRYTCEFQPQGEAFLRFSESIENHLRMIEGLREETSLTQRMERICL